MCSRSKTLATTDFQPSCWTRNTTGNRLYHSTGCVVNRTRKPAHNQATLLSPPFRYLEKQARDEWKQYYLDYKGLKDLIKESARQAETSGPSAFSPRTTSLSIVRSAKQADAAEERFFQKLEAEVRWVGKGGRGVGALQSCQCGAGLDMQQMESTKQKVKRC